jgi:hypothetical protein
MLWGEVVVVDALEKNGSRDEVNMKTSTLRKIDERDGQDYMNMT